MKGIPDPDFRDTHLECHRRDYLGSVFKKDFEKGDVSFYLASFREASLRGRSAGKSIPVLEAPGFQLFAIPCLFSSLHFQVH